MIQPTLSRKGIIVLSLVCFFLMWYQRTMAYRNMISIWIDIPIIWETILSLERFDLGWVLARCVIAVTAIIFGGITGGLVGVLSTTLVQIAFAITARFSIFSIVALTSVIFAGFFGFIIGTISQRFLLKTKEDTILKHSGIVFILVVLTIILIGIIHPAVNQLIINQEINPVVIGNVFRRNFPRSLVIGLFSSIGALVYLKDRQKKGYL